MKPLIAFLALLVLLPLGAAAQSQHEMNRQAQANFKKADAELNRVYQKVLKELPDKTAVELFRKAQRAWVAFRDADAASYSDEMRDGSAAPLLLYGRMRELTEARIKYFKHRFELQQR